MTETSLGRGRDRAGVNAAADAAGIELRIARLNQLALPATALRCLEHFCGQDLDAKLFCEMLRQDPALAARFVGIANSAFFALPRPVYDLKTAVFNVLGLDFARSLGLSMALSGCFNARLCASFDLRRYWTTALLQTSLVVQLIPPATPGGPLDRDALQLTGLIRSLGVLVLAHVTPTQCAAALSEHELTPNLAPALRWHCGIDHRETLHLLLPRWGLGELLPIMTGSTARLTNRQGPTTPAAEALALAHSATETCWAQAEDWDGHFPEEPAWVTDSHRRELRRDATRSRAIVDELLSVAA